MKPPAIRRAGMGALLALCVAPAAQAQERAQEPVQPACAAPDGCIEAILDAARAGRQADEFVLLKQLRIKPAPARQTILPATNPPSGLPPGQTLSPPPLHPPGLPEAPRPPLSPSLPETLGVGNVGETLRALAGDAAAPNDYADITRAHALGYLEGGMAMEARRLLEGALQRDPVYASYWTDLATVYARQGEHERAVAALIVADTWAFDRTALRRAYREAAASSPEPGLGRDFDLALQTIAAIESEQARQDAALPAAPAATAAHRPDGAGPARKPATIDFSSCDKPMYPKASLRREETGFVTVAFLVGADGRVQRLRKLKSSNHPLLDNAALFSLAVCRFHPATVDGTPVASWQPVQYVWTLDGTARPQPTPQPPQPSR